LAQGGAQEYFDFVPDMAVFAKGFANGMPVSAYVGKGELIDSARGLGISSTFAGDALSMAAIKAVAAFYEKNNVIEHLWKHADLLWPRVQEMFCKYGVKAQIKGYNVCPQLCFEDNDIKAKFFRNCYLNGVSLYDVSYVNYSHKEKDIGETLARMEKAVESL
jgi:glutamate-1-semialdehyde aminotransferase